MGIAGDWDRRISRRTLLKTGGSLTAGLALSGGLSRRALAAPIDGNPFALGVASGDPTPDGVVLWTRLAPDPLVPGGGMAQGTYAVRFEVATDEGFRRVVRRGSAPAFASEAHSARVELERLQPGTEYFYRFRVGRDESPVGRTRTAPPPGSAVGELRFAFALCQNFPAGYFNSYADIAAQELDLVVHLGDYIYEGAASGPLRPHAPAAEIVTLDDYRIRHGQYKTDVDLRAAHAALPWLVTWDDHEVENNYADEGRPGRRAGGVRPAPRRRLPGLLGAHAAEPLAQAARAGPAALPALPLGLAGDVQRARHAPVPLRPAGRLHARRARPERLLPERAGPLAHDPRRRAARVAVRRAGVDAGALERARAADGARALRPRSGTGPHVRRGRQLGRLCGGAPAAARLDRPAPDAEPDRHHGRLAPELAAQRAAELGRVRRAAGRDRVHGHFDHVGRRPAGAGHVVRRRPAEPAHRVPQQQPRLRALRGDAGAVDERVPDRPDGAPARRAGIDARVVRGRGRPAGRQRTT